MTKKYELSFWRAGADKFERWHPTLEAAQVEARRVLSMPECRGAGPATIHGPSLEVCDVLDAE